MLKRLNFRKSRLKPMLLIIALILSIMASVAFGHNAPGNKSINVLGYQYVNTTTLKVFFDKALFGPQAGQFRLQTAGGSNVPISSISTASGSGWTNVNSPTGTTVTITPQTALSYNTSYKVIVSSTISANNGLTAGYYQSRNDITLNFKTPDSNGTYSGTPTLTLIPVGTSNSVSMTVEAIADMPIDTSSITLSDAKLQKSDNGGSTFYDAIEDTTLDTNIVSGAECYVTQINDAHTSLFLPETLGGSTTPAYNLTSYNKMYKLSIPSTIKAVNGNVFSYGTQTFTTGQGDTPANMTVAPTVTGNTSSSVSLQWSDITASPVPAGYNVYYSTNPYFDFVKATDAVNHNGTTNTCTVTGLTSGNTYYFRIVPDNSYGEEAGYSPYASQAI